MYFKVASVVIVSLFLSGCSLFSKPKPPKKPEIEVVEEINATIENNSVKSTGYSKPKRVKEKYNLKPEPFSLKSNEEDPELLGPQTTIDRGLVKKDKPKSEEIEDKLKEKKDSFEKAVRKDEPKKDNIKETL